MIDMNYFKRLGLNSGKLAWRVFWIMAIACFGAFLKLAKMSLANSSPRDDEESHFDEYFKLPGIGDVDHPDWHGIYGKDYKKII